MSSMFDKSFPNKFLPPKGLDPGPMHILPHYQPYKPEPRLDWTGQVHNVASHYPDIKPNKDHIQTLTPNPFTNKQIVTEWDTNELIMKDPYLRTAARVASIDVGETQSSNFVSPQHLNMGWRYCGGGKGSNCN